MDNLKQKQLAHKKNDAQRRTHENGSQPAQEMETRAAQRFFQQTKEPDRNSAEQKTEDRRQQTDRRSSTPPAADLRARAMKNQIGSDLSEKTKPGLKQAHMVAETKSFRRNGNRKHDPRKRSQI
jgi:hypothetical protein